MVGMGRALLEYTIAPASSRAKGAAVLTFAWWAPPKRDVSSVSEHQGFLRPQSDKLVTRRATCAQRPDVLFAKYCLYATA